MILLWRRLAEPHPSLLATDQRRGARLLSTLLAALIIMGVLSAFISPLIDEIETDLPRTLLELGLLAAVYGLSRTRHYPLAAALAVVSVSTLIYVSATIGPRGYLLPFLIVGVLLSSLLLSVRATAVTWAAVLLAILASPLFAPAVKTSDVITSLYFIVIVGGLILVGAAVHARDQNLIDRQTRALSESEARYRQTLDHMMEGLQIIGFDWRYLYLNDAAARHGRQTKEALLGHTMMELYPGIENTEMFGMLRRCMNERIASQMENEFVHPDGQRAWFELHIQPAPEGVFVLSIDITGRKQAEAARRESEERFTQLFEQLLVGLALHEIICDEKGVPIDYRFLDVNPAFERLTGLRREQVVGRTMLEVLPATELVWIETYGRVALTGETVQFEQYSQALGRHFDVTAFRPRPGQFAVTFYDTTERRQAEVEVRRRAAHAEALNLITASASSADDVGALMETVLEHLPAALGLEHGIIWLPPDFRARGTNPELGRRMAQTASALGYSLPAHIRTTADWQKTAGTPLADIMAEFGIRASLGIPVMFEGRPIGGLSLLSPRPREWEVEEIALASAVGQQLGAAFHRIQAGLEVRRHAARAEALARAAGRLNAQLSLDAVLAAVCEETARALNVQAAVVTLCDEARGLFYYAAGFGVPPEYGERFEPVPRAVYDRVIEQLGPAMIVTDIQAVPGLRNADLYARLDLRSSAGVSMVRGGQLIGSLSILSFGETRQFTQDELVLLKGLADQSAQAIANANLFARVSRHLEHEQALREIDIAIAGSLDMQLSLAVILKQMISHLRVDAADILLLNPGAMTLEYAAGRGFRTEALQHTRLRLGEGHAGRAALERRTVSVADLRAEVRELSRAPLLPEERFVAYYGVPLVAKGQVKGVLEIFHRAPLAEDPQWLKFLETFAGQAAIAIDSVQLFDNLQRSNAELAVAYDATIEGWSRALDLRDRETEGHTQRVTEMTLRLAEAMGVRGEELLHIRRGALLHDIGKMGIPDEILLKPGPLTDEEWAIMRRHPEYAHEMLRPIPFLRPALDIPYCHHEKWDGTGYPRGLKGGQIPLAARIFAVVDVWDALRSDRPYRRAWPEAKVRDHIREQSGAHFDPKVVDVFLSLEQGP